MKNSVHFLSHLTQFFSEWEMFQTKVLKEIRHMWRSVTFFFKLCHLKDSVEK